MTPNIDIQYLNIKTTLYDIRRDLFSVYAVLSRP